MAVNRLITIGDLHCGSLFGMLPGAFVNSEDKVIEQNIGQKYLWKCWLDFVDKAKKFKPNVIVANGDLIDGKQRKQEGSELTLTLLMDQEEAAVQTCRFLRNACPDAAWLFVQGTEYHDGTAAHSLENIASRMEAKKYPGSGTGRYSREVLNLDLDGVVLNFAHHISAAAGLYRASALDREGIFGTLSGREGKTIPADGFIRSHVHNFMHVEATTKHMVTCPCWQLQTRFMRKRSVYRMMPDIGGLFITLDGDAKRNGEDPCLIRKLLYKLPEEKALKL